MVEYLYQWILFFVAAAAATLSSMVGWEAAIDFSNQNELGEENSADESLIEL